MSTAAAPLDDSQRAELASMSKFKVNSRTLINLYEAYKTRKINKEDYCKDLDEMNKIGSPDDLLALLDTTQNRGIDSRSHDARVAHFGSNMPKIRPRTTFCELVWDSLQDFMLQLLIVCAIFALITEMAFAKPEALSYAWVEGGGILAAVAFVSLFTAASDYNKETQFLENQKLEHASQKVSSRENKLNAKFHPSIPFNISYSYFPFI